MVELLVDDGVAIDSIPDKLKFCSLCLELHTTNLNNQKAAVMHLMQRNLAYLSSLSVKQKGSQYEAGLVEDIITAFLALPNAKEIKALECTDKILAFLSRSNVERLQRFHVISKSIRGAAFAGAAIRRMPRLTDLVVTVPNTAVLEACLGGAAGHMPSLKKIQLCGDLLGRIEDERPEPAVGASSIAGIAKALSTASSVSALRMDSQLASSDILQAVASILDAGGTPTLNELSIHPREHKFGSKVGLRALLAAVSRRGSIKSLSVEALAYRVGSPLARLIRAQAGLKRSSSSQGLRELSVSGLEGEHATSVLNALVEADHGIEWVKLRPHYVYDLKPLHYAALARAVGPSKRIRALDLFIDNNKILAKLEAFCEALQAGGSLTELELHRSISMLDTPSSRDPDATCLLAALAQKCPKLEALTLDGYGISDGVAAHLVHLPNLRHLELSHSMELTDVAVLADAVAGMSQLRYLTLCMFGAIKGKQDSQKLLDGLLRRSESGPSVASLEYLYLDNLYLDREAFEFLAEVLYVNHRLRTLHVDMGAMSMGRINEHTAAPIVDALQRHPEMCDVRPMGAFEPDVQDMIYEALEKGPIALQKRRTALLCFRRGFEAKRDAGMVFPAARDGRPLELGKRLRLGVLAGGARAQGEVGGRMVSALEAARLGGHADCVGVLEDVLGEEAEEAEGEDGGTEER